MVIGYEISLTLDCGRFSCGRLEIGLMGYQGIGCDFVVGRSSLIC